MWTDMGEGGHLQAKGRVLEQSLPSQPYKKPTLLISWSQTCSLWNCETIDFCCLSQQFVVLVRAGLETIVILWESSGWYVYLELVLAAVWVHWVYLSILLLVSCFQFCSVQWYCYGHSNVCLMVCTYEHLCVAWDWMKIVWKVDVPIYIASTCV